MGSGWQWTISSNSKKTPTRSLCFPLGLLISLVRRVPLENDYAAKVMSFGRPIRDRLKEQVETDINPLEDFEVKDLNSVESVLLWFAKACHFKRCKAKLARRIDDPLEFAKGLVIRWSRLMKITYCRMSLIV